VFRLKRIEYDNGIVNDVADEYARKRREKCMSIV